MATPGWQQWGHRATPGWQQWGHMATPGWQQRGHMANSLLASSRRAIWRCWLATRGPYGEELVSIIKDVRWQCELATKWAVWKGLVCIIGTIWERFVLCNSQWFQFNVGVLGTKHFSKMGFPKNFFCCCLGHRSRRRVTKKSV